MKDLYIIGCGGFGREVVDIVDAANAQTSTWNLVGFADDNPSPSDLVRVADLGLEVVGDIESLLQRQPANALIGIGNSHAREAIDRRLSAAGWTAPVLIHPSVTRGRAVTIGHGSILCAGVRLTTNIRIGRQVHLNLNTTVGHDSEIHDYASVNPLVAVSGNVTIGQRAMLGTHSAVLQNLRVGTDAVVGGSALVVKDVPSGVVVKGVPAR